MGVTLERVQFKFASIIGELCSEPDILSQFAVWVDLRLAEYKLKGSISLDCSGDTPDPVWLKGILSALLAKRLEKQKLKAAAQIQRIPTPTRTNVRKTPQSSNYPRHIEERQIVTVSPEPVIKQEPNEEDLFPVSLHQNETDNVGNGTKSDVHVRKRLATDFSSSPSHKERRLDNSMHVDVEPSNESLMSIIGGEDSDLTADPSNLSSFANNTSTDYNIAAEIAENAQRQIDAARDMSSGEIIPTAGTSDSTITHSVFDGGIRRRGAEATISLQEHDEEAGWQTEDNHTNLQSTEDSFSNNSGSEPGRSRSLDDSFNRRTVGSRHFKNVMSSAAVFERWLRIFRPNEQRKIEEIPPLELDPLLVQFYPGVKKTSGEDYDCESFRKLGSNLSIYLKAKEYPCSISNSKLFYHSQEVFLQKKTALRNLKISQIPHY